MQEPRHGAGEAALFRCREFPQGPERPFRSTGGQRLLHASLARGKTRQPMYIGVNAVLGNTEGRDSLAYGSVLLKVKLLPSDSHHLQGCSPFTPRGTLV